MPDKSISSPVDLSVGSEIAPSHPKVDDTQDVEKKRLELLKLNLEISQLKTAWYARPAYLSVLIPALIAIGTLVIAVRSNFFNNRDEILQLRNEKAALEASKFDVEKKALTEEKGKLSGEVTALQKQKEQLDQDAIMQQLQYDVARQKLNEELQKLSTDRTMAVAEVNEKRRQLDEQGRNLEANYEAKKSAMATQIARMETELERLNDKNFVQVREHVERIKTETNEFSNNFSERQIYKIVRGNQQSAAKYIAFLEETANDNKLGNGPRAYTYALLYSLTREDTWKNKLFALMRREAARADDQVWGAFVDLQPSWLEQPETVQIEFINFYLELARSSAGHHERASKHLTRELFEIQRSTHLTLDPNDSRTSRMYFDVVEFCIDVGDRYDNAESFYLLGRLAPEAGLILVAQRADKSLYPNRNEEGFAHIRDIVLNPFYFPETLISQIDFPSNNDEKWKEWLGRHRDWVNVWLEPGLKQLRRNPALVREY